MDDEAKIAACLICTLAEVMKDCKSCPFRLGLAVKALRKQDPAPAEIEAHTRKIKNQLLKGVPQ